MIRVDVNRMAAKTFTATQMLCTLICRLMKWLMASNRNKMLGRCEEKNHGGGDGADTVDKKGMDMNVQTITRTRNKRAATGLDEAICSVPKKSRVGKTTYGKESESDSRYGKSHDIRDEEGMVENSAKIHALIQAEVEKQEAAKETEQTQSGNKQHAGIDEPNTNGGKEAITDVAELVLKDLKKVVPENAELNVEDSIIMER